MNKIDEQQSNRIWAIKAIAIFTVFFAHMPWNGEDPFMRKFYAMVGIAGVPIFLFLSGYLNYGKSFKWKYRGKKLIIPVLIWGSVAFIFGKTLNSDIKSLDRFIIDWILYLIGSRSVYYFVTVLFCCMFFSNYFNRWILMTLSIISIYLSYDIIPHNDIFTRYLNPFNFLIYYQLGLIAREYDWKFLNFFYEITIGISLCIATWFCMVGVPSYFSLYCIINAVGTFLIIDGLVHVASCRFVIYIGKISFVIYLMHISIASFFNARLHNNLEFVKVLFAFLCVICIVYILDNITNKVNRLKKFRSSIGFK